MRSWEDGRPTQYLQRHSDRRSLSQPLPFAEDVGAGGGRVRLEKLGHEVFALCDFEGD